MWCYCWPLVQCLRMHAEGFRRIGCVAILSGLFEFSVSICTIYPTLVAKVWLRKASQTRISAMLVFEKPKCFKCSAINELVRTSSSKASSFSASPSAFHI